MHSLIKRFCRAFINDSVRNDLRKYYINYKLRRGIFDKAEKEMSILKYLVKKEDTVLDIGANIGSYSRILSKLVGPSGLVHAFEPIPLTYCYLIFNMRFNIYDNVVTHNVAVTESSGLCNVLLPDIGMEDIYQAGIGKTGSGAKFVVPAVSLDDLYPRFFQKIDFIKCDVEGAEALVFKGAQQIFKKHRPRIICEIGGGYTRFGYTASEIFKMFEALNYKAYFFNGERIVVCSGTDDRNINPNYIFLSQEDVTTEKIVRKINRVRNGVPHSCGD